MSPLIIALDFSDLSLLWSLVQQLNPHQCRLKVGKELFTRFGPALVQSLQQAGFEVFLDLKFHDIPNTVAQAVRAAADLGVWMVNVHASGGRAMLQAASRAIQDSGSATLLTAVTVLTSLEDTDLQEMGIAHSSADQVQRLARLASQCGVHGVVCSAREAAGLRKEFPEFILVTPGIRPVGVASSDQKRTVTPVEALRSGADYLVVGRPITQASDPAAALRGLLASLTD